MKPNTFPFIYLFIYFSIGLNIHGLFPGALSSLRDCIIIWWNKNCGISFLRMIIVIFIGFRLEILKHTPNNNNNNNKIPHSESKTTTCFFHIQSLIRWKESPASSMWKELLLNHCKFIIVKRFCMPIHLTKTLLPLWNIFLSSAFST